MGHIVKHLEKFSRKRPYFFGIFMNEQKKQFCIVFDHDGTLCNPMRNHQFELFKGIFELIKKLSKNDIELNVWSLRGRLAIVENLRELGILSHFYQIVGGDSGNPKPHPEGLREIIQNFELQHVVHIGDGAGDFHGAKALGVFFIAAAWENPNNEREWAKQKLIYPNMEIATSPNEVISIIEKKWNLKFKD